MLSAALLQASLLASECISGVCSGNTPRATCIVGDVWIDTDASAGAQVLVCTAANTFTIVDASSSSLSVTKTFSKDGTGADYAIVGSGAGAVGQTGGVLFVSAVASKIIVPDYVVFNFTYSTAAYTAGAGTVRFEYDSVGGQGVACALSAATSFGLTVNQIRTCYGISNIAAVVNDGLYFIASQAFTDPGTAAGTASVTLYYHLVGG